jgi:hypothetical protein
VYFYSGKNTDALFCIHAQCLDCKIMFGDSWSYVFFGALASADALFYFYGAGFDEII